MKIEDVGDFSFRIANEPIGRRGVVKELESIPGLKMTRRPALFSTIRDGDVFCEFEIDGDKFLVFEPWNDSNCYWIGPADGETRSPHIARVREHFAALLIPDAKET